jgi:hypothetical protein
MLPGTKTKTARAFHFTNFLCTAFLDLLVNISVGKRQKRKQAEIPGPVGF